MSDFLLQKHPERGKKYHSSPGIWYSQELKRWMITAPDLIREVMYSPAFSVPTYDVSAITGRLNLDLQYLDELRKWFPLAVEGERHQELREKFARHIAQNIKGAIDCLSEELEQKVQIMRAMPTGEVFCFYAAVLRPAMMASLLRLADLSLSREWAFEDLPLLFDVRLSLKKRKNLNQLVGNMIEQQPSERLPEGRYLRAALLTLSVNTLVGSVGLTIVEKLRAARTRSLAEIDWPVDLVRTGLPIIEKVAIGQAILGGHHISPGQGLRLFIESEGVSLDGDYAFGDMFFAVGSHKCLGMNFSKQAWLKFRSFMSGINRPMRVVQVSERPNDYVFNFPNVIKVQFDE